VGRGRKKNIIITCCLIGLIQGYDGERKKKRGGAIHIS